MERNPRRRIATSLMFCAFTLFLLTMTSGFEMIRAVQFLLIFAAGMNGGVALANFMLFRKKLGSS